MSFYGNEKTLDKVHKLVNDIVTTTHGLNF